MPWQEISSFLAGGGSQRQACYVASLVESFLALALAVDRLVGERVERGGQMEYLVRWVGYGPSGDTWLREIDIVDKGLIADLHKSQAGQAATGGLSIPRDAMVIDLTFDDDAKMIDIS